MKNAAHIFLGANSAQGFYSLYDQLLSGRFDDLLILKGGPGCGKSTFMRRVAEKLSAAGRVPVYVHCSGDPDSLDGVIFPALRTALVDGTSPHALEPTYAVACERYVDLTRFYDVERVKEKRAELMALTDDYRAHYRNAYHVLRAADEVEAERRTILHAQTHMDFARLDRRLRGVTMRELGTKQKHAGSVDYAFLGGMTHKGDICRFDTVDALCPRVYELCDSAGLGGGALRTLCEAAVNRGERVLACRDPDRPAELQHLLLPERGLAFVTSNERIPYGGKAHRRIRLDAMADSGLTRAEKARLRFLRRISRELRAEAVEKLADAKRAHDVLEGVYHPFVDFDAVSDFADTEAKRLLQRE